MPSGKSLRVAYGEALVELGSREERMVVLDADLAHATMTSLFQERYPDRFFNFGLAEANMMCAAAGMALSGLLPFASTFALFGTGRAYEQVRNSIAHMGANVKLGLSHSGLSVGEDGASHQSFEDIALMRGLPGMTVFVPCDPAETRRAVFAAAAIEGPVYIRVARPVVDDITSADTPFVPGKSYALRDGSDLCIAATGLAVKEALGAADILAAQGIQASVLNFHTIKPFDSERLVAEAGRCGAIVTVEEHSIIGGLGSAAAEALSEAPVASDRGAARLLRIGIADRFGRSGKPAELFAEYGISADRIAARCEAFLRGKE
jgi:Transketolase, C-terminal subunit